MPTLYNINHTKGWAKNWKHQYDCQANYLGLYVFMLLMINEYLCLQIMADTLNIALNFRHLSVADKPYMV